MRVTIFFINCIFILLTIECCFSQSSIFFEYIENQAKKSETLRNQILRRTLFWRCSSLFPSSSKSCKKISRELLNILDVELVKKSSSKGEFLAFSKKSKGFFENQKKTKKLQYVAHQFLRTFQNPKGNSLFEQVRGASEDFDEAIETMGIGFQDLSPGLNHLKYLTESDQDPILKEFYQTLVDLRLRVNFACKGIEQKENCKQKLSKVYPRLKFFKELDYQRYLSASIYHFYVPAYLANILVKKGYSKNLIMSTVFSLFCLFELEEGRKIYRFSLGENFSFNQYKSKDLFSVFSGLIWGIENSGIESEALVLNPRTVFKLISQKQFFLPNLMENLFTN